MTEQLQLRRGAASQVAAFTGAQGELVVDTTNNRAVVNDGATAGGWPAAKLAEVITNARTAVADAAYTAHATDRLVAYASLSAARVVTLCAAAAYPTGTRLTIVDESGACSAANTITVQRAGSDMIGGATGAALSSAYGYLALESDGVGKWTVVDQATSNLGPVGVGTAADPNNPLSVYGASALFNGVSFSFTINKAAAADTASIIFEDGFSGRAQMGLNGSDNFSFKVSPNGSSWTTAIALDETTGAATFANQRTAVSDAAYLALVTDRLIAYTALTAARVVTLPAASAFPPGQPLIIVDESGACSAANTITVSRAGSDTINGAASAFIQTARGYITLESNGSNAWTVLSASSTASLVINETGQTISPFPSSCYLYAGALGANVVTVDSYGNGAAPNPAFIFRGVRGTPASPSALNSGDTLAGFGGRGCDGSSISGTTSAKISFLTTQAWASGQHGAAIAFNVTLNNTATLSEGMRLDNTGYLGVGTTSPAQKLDVNGAVAIGGATAIGSDRSVYLGSYTVSTLPAAGNAGRMAFASNCRMFNGAGTQEGAGAGTGGLVVDNGTAWKIAGTNVTAIA
jgi:hypothetical protein